MGIYDSARTRIAPVFGRLQCLDPSGRLWLQGLLELGNTRKLPRPQGGTAGLRVARWWPRQARLPAPPELLRWLLQNAEQPRNAAAWGRHPEVKENRRRVVDRDAATLTEALKRLDERRRSGRAWYVLEGPTQPDVYLDTEEAVIVIEGKRSEPGPITSTAWMPVRHQMLRQLDAAWEVRQGRRVYGLFIVEAEEGTESATPTVWRQVVDMTISEEVLRGSLPHRSSDERSEIAGALLGVTTWQAVCEEFQIPSQVLIPEVFDDRPEPRSTRRRSGSTQQPSSLPPELAAAGDARPV